MKIKVFDIEADGFIEDATIIHCLVSKEILTGEKHMYYQDTLPQLVEDLNGADVLIGHNILGYDLDMLEKFYGFKSEAKILDTLVWSQVLNPDRQLPKGCPTSYKNPLTGKLDRITPHSLAAWGYRVARSKPQHYDWTTFTPQMLKRCDEDVEINHLVLNALLEEAEMTLEEAIS